MNALDLEKLSETMAVLKTNRHIELEALELMLRESVAKGHNNTLIGFITWLEANFDIAPNGGVIDKLKEFLFFTRPVEFHFIPSVAKKENLPEEPEENTACFLEEETDGFGNNLMAFWRMEVGKWECIPISELAQK